MTFMNDYGPGQIRGRHDEDRRQSVSPSVRPSVGQSVSQSVSHRRFFCPFYLLVGRPAGRRRRLTREGRRCRERARRQPATPVTMNADRYRGLPNHCSHRDRCLREKGVRGEVRHGAVRERRWRGGRPPAPHTAPARASLLFISHSRTGVHRDLHRIHGREPRDDRSFADARQWSRRGASMPRAAAAAAISSAYARCPVEPLRPVPHRRSKGRGG